MIVYVGKLFRSKGIFLLIDAYVEYKSRTGSTETLTIIGDGTDREEFINYVPEMLDEYDKLFTGNEIFQKRMQVSAPLFIWNVIHEQVVDPRKALIARHFCCLSLFVPFSTSILNLAALVHIFHRILPQ